MAGDTRRMLLYTAAFIFVSLIAASSLLTAADWPQWRGPNRDSGTTANLPTQWPQQLNQLWRVKIGSGHSGPVVAGNRLVSFSRTGEDEIVSCFDVVSGKQLWRTAYPAPYEPAEAAKPHGKGPFATPSISGDMVYTLGISGILSCFDISSGKLLWKKDFSNDFGSTYPEWGTSSSPLVTSQACIALVGGKEGGAVIAFDKSSGQEIWKLTLKEGPGYASPLIVSAAGRPTLLVVARNRVLGIAPDSGSVIWEQPFTTSYEMNIADPMIAGKSVLLSGYRRGTSAYDFTQPNELKQQWHTKMVSAYMSSPVLYGEHLYILSQERSGLLQCLAVADGSVVWTSKGENVGMFASIIRVGEKLLVFKTDGELLVVAADPSAFKLLGRSTLSKEAVWAQPAVAGNRLFVKDASFLTAFALSEAKESPEE